MHFFLILLMLVVMNDEARRANQAYERGDYVAAEAAYLQALANNPNNARLYFNLGNALAKQGKFDEAVTAYERFRGMSSTAEDRALADYNIGNIFGFQEKWDRALNQYRDALRQNPEDRDARLNYEYAWRQQQMQPPQEQQNQQNESSDDQNEQDQQQQSGDSNDQGDQQNPNNQPQGEQDSQDQNQPQQRPQPKSDMSREEADRILNALENKEKDLLRDFHKNQVPSNTRHAKNW
jgi:Ca-activated chloride channel family protein